MRGLVGHLVYGAVVAFVVEAAWLLLGAQPPKRVSGHTVPGGHRLEPEPVLVDAGESRILAVLELRVCNDEQEVALDEIEPLTVMGDGATLDGFWLLPGGTDLDDTGLATLPSGSVAAPPGDRITVDEPRLLAARLLGTGEGNFILGSVRLHYHAGEANNVAFGTSVESDHGRRSPSA